MKYDQGHILKRPACLYAFTRMNIHALLNRGRKRNLSREVFQNWNTSLYIYLQHIYLFAGYLLLYFP